EVLFCAFKRNLVKEVKVCHQPKTLFFNSESLAHKLIGMAQSFVRTDNINLMYPGGHFGTRYQGGEDHWETQYMFTKLSPITRSIFPEDDNVLRNYLQKNGKSIEHTWFVPILPMVLVNGIEVNGNGWSTYIPKYNPRDIVANLRRLLNDEYTEPMHPWYMGFKVTGVTYTITGIIEAVDNTMLRITELPICCWTQDYRECNILSDSGDVYIDILLSEEDMVISKQEGLAKKFNLATTIGPINMHLFGPDGNIRKYDTPEQKFFKLRLEFYEKRKEALLEKIKLSLKSLNNKVRFIFCIVNDDIIISKRKKAELLLELQQKNFDPLPEKNEESPEAARGLTKSDYEYLLSVPISTLTWENIQELIDEKNKLENELEKLSQTSPRSLWLSDLNALEKELDVLDRMDAEVVEERKARIEK
uniref:DNA topoisomerase (ATP-hydrolyzing) n=1 Tax=Setaria italica TaxID=4555 RepID=K3YZD2_SETIT